jgi:RDD family
MAQTGGQVRLDTVVSRPDWLIEAIGPALFTALVAALVWPFVLGYFWGLFGMPWVSLVVGLACTAAVIRWGVRLGRGSFERARRAPYLVITADEMLVWNAAGAGVARIALDAIRVVAIDAPSVRQRRADRVRFPVGVGEGGPAGWLYCRDESRLFVVGLGFRRTPNVAIVFSRPVRLGPETAARLVPGFLVAVTDPPAARAAFTGRVPVRPLVAADLDGICSPDALPVRRLGQHGLREVRDEDRRRARLVDAFTIFAAFWLLVPWLAPPGRNQLPGVTAAFALAWFLCDVPFSALTGQTPGKFVLGLRAVRIEDGSARLGLARATARSLLRLLNGLVGSWASQLAEGDALGRLAPGLSLADGIGAGTLVVTDGVYRRLWSDRSARQRERAVAETMIEIKYQEPSASGHAAWISLLFVLFLFGSTAVYIAGQAIAGQPSQPGTTNHVLSPTPSPHSLLPTGAVIVPTPLPAPSFSIPMPTLHWPGTGGG